MTTKRGGRSRLSRRQADCFLHSPHAAAPRGGARSWWRLAALLLLLLGSASEAGHPLEPMDTSSPRATMRSFIALTEEAVRRGSAYLEAPSPATQKDALVIGDRAVRLFDLRTIPPVNRREVAADTFYLLWEVLDRLELPDISGIPDVTLQVKGGEQVQLPSSWRIPHTDIAIARIEDGPRAGEYLFSADTVKSAPYFYEAVKGLPYQRPHSMGDVVRLARIDTGWMIPLRWVEALPDWANAMVLGEVVWKAFALLLLFGLASLLVTVVVRWSRRGSPDARQLRAYLRRIAAPAIIAAVAQLLYYFGTFQINPSGVGQEALDFAVEIAQGIALVWGLWLVFGWVAEAIIGSPRIADESLDAHLIRLAARVLGILVIAALGFRVAEAIGVPVYGLVAGAGVGGIAVALAAKSTLENFMGALNLFADRPVRVGDLCRYDPDQSGEWRAVGTVESIGLRSTKIRKLDRSLLTIPNAEFAQRDILNLSACDRFLLTATLGLRYETTDDQLRFLLAELRELLHAHPMTVHTTGDPLRVRFVGFGDYSLNVSIRAYTKASSYDEFLAIKEDIFLRIIKIVAQAGTGFAFPSRTLYLGRDGGLDEGLRKEAERKVRDWAAAQTLPFPDLPEADRKRITDTLDYPPAGSPGADLG